MTDVKPVELSSPPYGITHVVPDGFHTRSQAAQLIGRSKDTLRRWQTNEQFVPTHTMQVGKLKVWLYTDADIDQLRKVSETIVPGRPRSKEQI